MRKIFIIFAFLLSAFNAFADGMSANDIVLTDDKQSMLDISLSNTSTDIVGLQFNLSLPEGITPVMDGDRVAIEPSGRLHGSYSLRGKRVADGSYLFTFLSNDRTPIGGKSGKLFSIALQNTALLPIGSYEAKISGVTISDMNGNEQSLADARISISVIHSYKLTYKVDGNIYKEYTLNYGDAITPEAAPTKEGYTFSGWSEIPATMPAHDVEVNGSFTVNKYKVTFISEGTVIKEETLAYGSPITAPANPTKMGHTFTGWGPIVDATVPAHDVTYTAQFSVNQYTITFDTDGGSYIAPITQNYGTSITSPANPTKEGYTFSGWSPAIPATMPAENMTIKAQWTVNSYKFTYKVDGNIYKEYTLNYGAAITSEAEPTKEGYTFSGWSEIPATMPAHDVEVNGSFTVNKYKVTFISDGAVIKEENLAYGTPITAPANPVKVGHSFTGWNPAVDATVPAHDVTYTAQFSVNQYTITFDTDGGSYVAPITQNYGTSITSPANPTKEGYTFSGWSPAIPATMPAENMTIKAQWTVNSYKLTYKVDGNIYKEYTLNYGAAITPEAAPTKEGYTFSGWSEIPASMPAHDVEVNGSFIVNKYKVTFISDGAVIKEEALAYGTPVTAPANPVKVGHSFTGWNPAVDATVPAHDVTYTAQFSVNQYTITFDTDGGSYVAPITQNYGTSITSPANPTKEGYTFSGWSPAIPATMPAENMTIKAQWTVNSYKLTYKVDGNIYKEYTLNYGAAITRESEPVKEGYTFSGWSEIPASMPAHDVEVSGSFTKGAYKLTYYVDDTKYKELSYDFGDAITPEAAPMKEGYTFSGWSEIPATMPAHDVEVNGSFTVNKYKVTFISDGATIKEENLAYGSPITAPVNPTKIGHIFVGWNPTVDATVPAHDVAYTAQFSVNQYTITFNTDGGSYVAPIKQNYGTTITKPANPTKEGYTFSGWNPAVPETMPAENVTIKATWTVNSYKLTYKVDGSVYKEYTLNYGDIITPEAEPTKEGHTFSGWSVIPATMPAHDVEVNGSFTKGAYKLTYYIDGTKYKELSYDFGDAITPETEPTKEGYTFSGWSVIPATMPAHDVDVNGSFTANNYKVTFISEGVVIKEETLPFGTSITAPANPTKTGYTFTGWNPAVDATVPAHDVTYTAEFTVNIYKVSYYVGEELVHEDEVAFGNTFSLWNYMPDEDGFVFNGWIGETYDTMPAHDISYKADITSGIEFIKDNPDTVLGIYTLDGKKVDRMSRGVFVIKMKNGSTMKYIN